MSPALRNRHAVVIGGGWSGIAASWYLRQAGARVDLLDDQPALGGRSRSVALGDRTATLGGKNIGKRYSRFRTFVEQHGGGQWEHFGISTSQIDRGGLTAIEGSHRGRAVLRMLGRARPVDTVRLIRFARAIKAESENRYLDGPAFIQAIRRGDRPLGNVFGDYLTEHLIRPMTIRMNGAEPEEAFLGNLGTNLALVLDSFDQLAEGFDPVFRQFEKTIDVHHGVTVTEVHRADDGIRGVSYRSDTGTSSVIDADLIVIAIPATHAAALVKPFDSATANALSNVPYHPVGVVVAEYDKDVFGDVGRAVVFPKGHVISNAGAYGKDDKHTVRYTFSGRAARALLQRSPDTAALREEGERELGRYLPLSGATALRAVSETWDHGLCAYGPDHHLLSHKLVDATRRTPGLTFAGDYVAGASIEACFVSAERALARLSASQEVPGR